MRATKFSILLLLLLLVGLLAFKRFLFFDATFAQEDLAEVRLLKVEHPFLGGVLEQKPLEASKIASLHRELQWGMTNGPAQLYTCFVIQLKTHSGETLSLRTDGQYFARVRDDYFYKVQGSENLIAKYWGANPDCQAATTNSK